MESQLDTEQERRWKKKSGILKATSNGLRQQSVARRAVIKVRCSFNIVRVWCFVQGWNQMENSLVTYGFNKTET